MDRFLDKLGSRLAGRSYWKVHYRDRAPVHELQCSWEDVPRRGMTRLELICPNGQIGTLGLASGADLDDRAFQFKIGGVDAGLGLDGSASQVRRRLDAHVVGIVYGRNGECLCYAWEPDPRGAGRGQLIGPFDDNLFLFRYGGPVTAAGLRFDLLGAVPD